MPRSHNTYEDDPMRPTQYAAIYPQFAEKLAKADSQAIRLLLAIKSATGRRRRQVHAFLVSPEVDLSYFHKAVSHKGLLHTYPPDRLVEVASKLSCFSANEESVQLIEKRVSAHKTRLINSFGPERYALQCKVCDVLRAIHTLRGDQYLLSGGVPAALRAVEAAYRDGYLCGQTVDAVNFYPSIRCEGLTNLLRPLPRSTVQNVICTKARELHPTKAGFSPSAAAQDRPSLRGQLTISQGSATSPIVGEIVMKKLLDALPLEARITAYADDAFIHGKTEEEVATNVKLLQCAAERHPAGPLRLRTTGPFRLNTPFDFLGHEGRAENDGFVLWTPSSENLSRYLSVVEDPTASADQLLRTISKVSNWRRSYHEWDDGSAWEILTRSQLWVKYAYKTADRISLSIATRGILECWRYDGMCMSFDYYLPEPSGDRQWQVWRELKELLTQRSECHFG